MTEEIKQRLQNELNTLETELRVYLPREIKKAVEYGDLRENAEYKAALERQELVRAKVADLRRRLSELGTLDLSRIPTDRVAYGSKVVVYDFDKEEETTYMLVTPEESDPQNGAISVSSPIGKSFMGKEEGDEVKVQTPSGMRNFEIKKLYTIHDLRK